LYKKSNPGYTYQTVPCGNFMTKEQYKMIEIDWSTVERLSKKDET